MYPLEILAWFHSKHFLEKNEYGYELCLFHDLHITERK